MNDGNVRMVQGGKQMRLALEPPDPLTIARDALGKRLDRDVAIERGVSRLPHLTHAAGPDGAQNFIAPNPKTRSDADAASPAA
jgi:hypothetical protein